MTKEETLKVIDVMLHYANGGDIEFCDLHGEENWRRTRCPLWDWTQFSYRIAEIAQPQRRPDRHAEQNYKDAVYRSRQRHLGAIAWAKLEYLATMPKQQPKPARRWSAKTREKWLSKSPEEWNEIRQKRADTKRRNAKLRAKMDAEGMK